MLKHTQLSKITQLLNEPVPLGLRPTNYKDNRPTDPIVGDSWADEDTLEIKIWDGREWIVLPEPPTTSTSTQFGDDNLVVSASPGDELTLIPGGIETLSFEEARATKMFEITPTDMSINYEGKTLVAINLKTGLIEYGENY
ncbi:hypothetical protein LCGC14_2592680, partial [marine sediment metagenome]